MSLTRKIVLAMIFGLLFGLLLHSVGESTFVKQYLIDGLFHVVGSIFMASLKVLVVPLVFISLVCGTAAIKDIKKLGRMGVKTLGIYLFTTTVAITTAIAMAVMIQPGHGFEITSNAEYVAKAAPSLTEVLINMFPTNPFKAMVEGQMLQIIIFSGLTGIALTLSGKPGKNILNFFDDANVVVLKMVDIIIGLAPYGVFALIAKVFAVSGFDAIGGLIKYFMTVVIVLLIHGLIVYPSLLKLFSGLSPIYFFKQFKDVLLFAFSTSSSNATIPVTMETVEQKLGVKNEVAAFTIPLGATINMDGTAIMQGVATAFIAQAYGIDIGLTGYMSVVVTATLASIGTAGVPGVGIIMLAMVLKQVGLPEEGIAIILGVDRLLDMMRTAVNVTGDAVVTCIVAKGEKALVTPKTSTGANFMNS